MTEGYHAPEATPPRIAIPDAIPPFAAFAALHPGDPHEPIADVEEALLHPRAVPHRRLAFRRGRSAAHAALGSIGLDSAPILSGPHREPIWPPGVSGSISHAAGIGVALVAPAAFTDGIGVDIEARRHAPELEQQVPRPEEWAWLTSLEPDERSDAVFALFSAKESIFKAFFPRVGSFFGFEAAALRPAAHGFEAHLVHELDAHYPPDRTFAVGCRWFGPLVLTWLILPKTSWSP